MGHLFGGKGREPATEPALTARATATKSGARMHTRPVRPECKISAGSHLVEHSRRMAVAEHAVKVLKNYCSTGALSIAIY